MTEVTSDYSLLIVLDDFPLTAQWAGYLKPEAAKALVRLENTGLVKLSRGKRASYRAASAGRDILRQMRERKP